MGNITLASTTREAATHLRGGCCRERKSHSVRYLDSCTRVHSTVTEFKGSFKATPVMYINLVVSESEP